MDPQTLPIMTPPPPLIAGITKILVVEVTLPVGPSDPEYKIKSVTKGEESSVFGCSSR